MALLPICTYPDPILRQKTECVKEIDETILHLLDDMAETMYAAPGIGLAANQVGKALRVLVIDVQQEDDGSGLLALINPVLVDGRGETTNEEGCLSVPDYWAKVTRHDEVVVSALDREGRKIEIRAGGLLAVALQHEIDHLDGKLFIDRIGPVARDIFKRKWKKKHKDAKE